MVWGLGMKTVNRMVAAMVEATCIFLLVVLTSTVVYATTMRYLGASPSWYDEIAQVLLAWLSYFAAVYAMFHRQHMGFAGLVLAMPKPFKLFFVIFAEVAVLGFFGVAVWFGWAILPIASFDSLVSLRWVSLGVVQSVIPITGALMIYASLVTFPKILRDALAGVDRDHAEIAEAIAAAEADLLANERKGVQS
jgi:TRAP-type C4-dicarboxylate transport system permease small subunit